MSKRGAGFGMLLALAGLLGGCATAEGPAQPDPSQWPHEWQHGPAWAPHEIPWVAPPPDPAWDPFWGYPGPGIYGAWGLAYRSYPTPAWRHGYHGRFHSRPYGVHRRR